MSSDEEDELNDLAFLQRELDALKQALGQSYREVGTRSAPPRASDRIGRAIQPWHVALLQPWLQLTQSESLPAPPVGWCIPKGGRRGSKRPLADPLCRGRRADRLAGGAGARAVPSCFFCGAASFLGSYCAVPLVLATSSSRRVCLVQPQPQLKSCLLSVGAEEVGGDEDDDEDLEMDWEGAGTEEQVRLACSLTFPLLFLVLVFQQL